MDRNVALATGHPFAAADDFAHPPQSEPGWSESFLVQAYSPDTGVGIFGHSNRCHFDPRLWSEVFAIYLPDDQFVVAKGFGYAAHDTSVGGSLSYDVVEPFTNVKVIYRGAGQRISGTTLRAAGAPSGLHVGVEMELTQLALSPPFPVGDMRPGAFGHTHYEQHVLVSGHVTFDGTRIAMEGTGFRDHTWGARDLSVMGNHVWLHGEFPSGRWFSVIQVNSRTGGDPLLTFHVVGHRERSTPATLVNHAPVLTAESQVWDPYQLTLDVDGSQTTIRGEILAPMTFSFVGPVEMTLGADCSGDASHTIFECQTRLLWDGEIGYGLSERSIIRSTATKGLS